MVQNSKPLALLSLDGGGIQGISELVILDEIMYRVQAGSQDSKIVPLPADHFDMICGTSTGGLIAILLGRLRMSVPEAIECYRELAKTVFSDRKPRWKDGMFKATKLEAAIKLVVGKKLGNDDEHMFEKTMDESQICKTFVCAMTSQHISGKPVIFRTWSANRNRGLNPHIWEAARATSAAPTFFKPVEIGSPGLKETFVDGAVGCNNPIFSLIEEATREFDPDRKIGCIVSIGSGMRKVTSYGEPSSIENVAGVNAGLLKAFANLATSSETAASRMEDRYHNCPDLYHRLNVDRGLEDIMLDEWDKLGEVRTHTKQYLQSKENSAKVDKIVRCLIGSEEGIQKYVLSQIDGTVQPSSPTLTMFRVPSFRAKNFVHRRVALKRIEQSCSTIGESSPPSVFVLPGIGGCGKSQLALKYCHQARSKGKCSATF